MEEALQQIRQHTLDNIKPEMAPWAKNYTPKMEDIQTRLRIVHPDYKKCGEFTDFDKLFAEPSAKRVLVKGRIGTGKTMLGKKLAFDWAKGLLVRFSIVLFVSMKLVNPTTPIENVIVQQYSENGLSITEQTIEFVLKRLRGKALIVIDEFSDDPSYANRNCLKFLRTHRESEFKLLVISDWFDTRELHQEIQLVCEIQCCTLAEQEKYMSLLPKTDFNIKAVLDVRVNVPTMFCDLQSFNHLLVMFLCFIGDKKPQKLPVSLLDIYLAVCMKLLKGSTEKFLSDVKVIGQRAYDALTKRTTIAKDSCLKPHVDAGILISSDNCLVFPHDTVRVFFGALYFILMLDAGQTIDTLVGFECKQLIFLVDPLFLYFCLGLLDDQKHISLPNRERIYLDLKVYTRKLVDFVQMDLKDVQTMYPVFDHCCTPKTFDEIGFSFLSDVLSMCPNVRSLILRPIPPHDRMWKLLQSYIGSLNIVVLAGHDLIQNDISDHSSYWDFGDSPSGSDRALNVLFDLEQVEYVEEFLKLLRVSNRHLVVRFNHHYMNATMIDLAAFAKDNVKQLHVHHSVFKHHSFELFVDADVISCPQLTNLAFNDVHIEDVALECLARSVHDQKLPNLKYLSLAGSKESVRCKIALLFQSPWPKLVHLDVSNCQLDQSDLKVICAATNSALENNLPSLTSLAISPSDVTEGGQSDIFVESWMKLEALSLVDVYSLGSVFVKALEKEQFPSLKIFKVSSSQGQVPLPKGVSSLTYNVAGMTKTQVISKQLNHQALFHLDLSFSELSDGLKYIVRHKLPSLENLILRQCKLTWQDFQLLADADKENRLPKLRHLDVAYNDFFDVRQLIKSKWKKLEVLNVSWRVISQENNLTFLVEAVELGSLGALQKLSLHTNNYYAIEQERCRTCKQLRMCRPSDPCNPTQSMVLRPIAQCLDKVHFPSLRTVHVYDTNRYKDDAAVDRQSIRKHGVSVYFTYCENPCVIKINL